MRAQPRQPAEHVGDADGGVPRDARALRRVRAQQRARRRRRRADAHVGQRAAQRVEAEKLGGRRRLGAAERERERGVRLAEPLRLDELGQRLAQPRQRRRRRGRRVVNARAPLGRVLLRQLLRRDLSVWLA